MARKPHIQRVLAFALLLATASTSGQSMTNQVFAARVRTAFALAQKNYLANTNSPAAAIELARASFDFSELATNEPQRAARAETGIAACRQALAHKPNSAPGHYYLAMNLGKLAQAKAPSLTAYKLVHEVEREFVTAAQLDVRFDYAGPARGLGELYFQAPGWPFSVGNKRKANEWLERAVTLAPEYPGNHLNLAEAQWQWRETDAFQTTMKNLESRWPSAKTNFTGAAWELCWADWNAQRTALQSKFQKTFKRVPES
jgi:tetratricopeptide (TPR) repeat protein